MILATMVLATAALAVGSVAAARQSFRLGAWAVGMALLASAASGLVR